MFGDNTFTEFVDSNQGIIRNYAASLGVPWDYVDEVVHEAFVQYFLAQNRRPDHVEPLRWLKSIARNCVLLWFRTRKNSTRLVALSKLLEPETDAQDDLEMGTSASIAALNACLQSLPDQSRRVLSWYYLENLATDDIAKRLRQTASGVRMQVLRMREALSNCIRRRLSGGSA